jgi:acyl-coenzyme A thioesterase PaaI-like protein
MILNTHLKLNSELSGEVIELRENYAKVEQKTTPLMVADNLGLIHGGFTFSAADFTAMACINDPFVVLAKSEVKFLAPIKLGQSVIYEATLMEKEGKKSKVEVIATVDEKEVFKGVFSTVSLDNHILE